MTSKLEIFNEALFRLKSRRLAALTDNRPERRTLDELWDGVLAYLIEGGMWNFASRTEELQSSDTVEPNFGYQYAFEKPDDYVRIIKIADNEMLYPTLDDFMEEGDYFLAWVDPLYLQYVSNDTSYGADPGKWTASFARALALELAYRAAPHVTGLGEDGLKALETEKTRALTYAKGKDAVNQAIARPPPGRLVRSRGGTRGSGTPPWRVR